MWVVLVLPRPFVFECFHLCSALSSCVGLVCCFVPWRSFLVWPYNTVDFFGGGSAMGGLLSSSSISPVS